MTLKWASIVFALFIIIAIIGLNGPKAWRDNKDYIKAEKIVTTVKAATQAGCTIDTSKGVNGVCSQLIKGINPTEGPFVNRSFGIQWMPPHELELVSRFLTIENGTLKTTSR